MPARDSRARQRRSVTAVVTFAAKNKRFFAGQVVLEASLNRVEAGGAGGFHQEQGRDVIVFDSETVDLADLFSGEYGLHAGMIG